MEKDKRKKEKGKNEKQCKHPQRAISRVLFG